MTKTKMNELRISLAHAVLHRRKVVIDGRRIVGVMIGFIPEKEKKPVWDKREANLQIPIWSLRGHTITVSKTKIKVEI